MVIVNNIEDLSSYIDADICSELKRLSIELDILIDTIFETMEFSWGNQGIFCTYFKPESNEERQRIINNIEKYIILLNRVYSYNLIEIYKQMEKFLFSKIESYNKKKEYKKYEKKLPDNVSKFKAKFDFLINYNNYHLNNEEKQLFNFINKSIRNNRNKAAHDEYNLLDLDYLKMLLSDDKNYMIELNFYYQMFVNEIIFLQYIKNYFFVMCDKFIK